MNPESERFLTRDEIIENGLDDSEKNLYKLVFLFNDKLNKATQPHAFKIKSELIPKLAERSVGMPYVVPDRISKQLKKHIETSDGSPESLLEYQKKYSIGEIVKTIVSASGNVWGIVNIFPEYHDDVKNNKVLPYTSPTIGVIKQNNYEVEDGYLLNIHAVEIPGYDPRVAGVQGVCEGGIRQCMSELKVLAASGGLKEYQRQLFSYVENNETEQHMTDEIQNKISGLESSFSKGFEALQKQILDIQKIVSATGEAQVVETKKEIDTLKAELETIKKSAQQKEEEYRQSLRLKDATSIVESQLKKKIISLEKKDETLKQLLEKKDSFGNPADLSVAAEIAKQEAAEILGASGHFQIPSIVSTSHKANPFDIVGGLRV